MPRSKRHLTTALCSGLAPALVAAHALAGPLDPPQGPVSSTYKTLHEVEPRIPIGPDTTPGDQISLARITQPGSYYLTGNFIGGDRFGIVISADNVTLDLMGFEVVGQDEPYHGIFVFEDEQEDIKNVTVCNGAVTGWGQTGVNLARAEGARVFNVRACFNGSDGIYTGPAALVTDCIALGNEGAGIATGSRSVIRGCTASLNRDGIKGIDGTILESCVSSENQFYGFNMGNGARISGCTARANGDVGMRLQISCVALDNVCSANGTGILVGGDSNRLEGNHCSWNDLGFDVDGVRNFIVRNTAFENTLNWDVRDQNVCLVVAAKLAGAIRGDEGGAVPGSSEPNANFSHSP